MTSSSEYSPTELLACVASRLLEQGTSVFVGTGLPMIAAIRNHTPRG
jgi:acyl CoA:acetate/3-ketoacid CoA transferase beta subunit